MSGPTTMVSSAQTPPGRRREVLRVLREAAQPVSISTIAGELGVHPNTARFHLDTLVERGQAERIPDDAGRPGRPRLLFRAVRRMDPGGTRQYLLLADILSASLTSDSDAGARALEAGRAWGRKLATTSTDGAGAARDPAPKRGVRHLITVLERLGFEPEHHRGRGGESIGLRHCPFLELAETRSQVVCPIHLGLMQGFMQASRSSSTVDRLDAWVQPDLCLAHVSPAEES